MNFLISGAHISPVYLMGVGFIVGMLGGFFGVGAFSLSTVFRKSAVTQITVPIVTQTNNTVPVAKAVPNKPGFVYNPFQPNSHILLDVRGKPSGTKLIEPGSGKLFVVP